MRLLLLDLDSFEVFVVLDFEVLDFELAGEPEELEGMEFDLFERSEPLLELRFEVDFFIKWKFGYMVIKFSYAKNTKEDKPEEKGKMSF